MQQISFDERLATACVSTAASAITLVALPWVISSIGPNSEAFLLYDWIFSKLGISVLIVSAITGFLLGSEKMANVFSFFWGTHSIWEEEWFQKVFGGLFLIFAVALLFYFFKK